MLWKISTSYTSTGRSYSTKRSENWWLKFFTDTSRATTTLWLAPNRKPRYKKNWRKENRNATNSRLTVLDSSLRGLRVMLQALAAAVRWLLSLWRLSLSSLRILTPHTRSLNGRLPETWTEESVPRKEVHFTLEISFSFLFARRRVPMWKIFFTLSGSNQLFTGKSVVF